MPVITWDLLWMLKHVVDLQAPHASSSRWPVVSDPADRPLCGLAWLNKCLVPEQFERQAGFIPTHVSTFGKTQWTSKVQQALLTMLPGFTTPRSQEVQYSQGTLTFTMEFQ